MSLITTTKKKNPGKRLKSFSLLGQNGCMISSGSGAIEISQQVAAAAGRARTSNFNFEIGSSCVCIYK